MLTIDQSNYLHSKMREMEEDVKRVIGLEVHFGVYMRSKNLSQLTTAKNAVSIIAEALGIKIDDLLSPSKKGDLVMARKVIAAVLRSNYRTSLNDIAELLNKNDHTTAMALLKSATNMMNSDDKLFIELYKRAQTAIENQK